jgi:hypothetical protein
LDSALLNPEIQKFITSNLDANSTQLALQKNPFPNIDWKQIIIQIVGKQKAKDKLPSWYLAENILYPSKISLEQTSSEKTANYKASLVSGKHLIDLTGGFGVDDFYFSKKVKQITHCEINEKLSQIVAHNFSQLNVTNCDFMLGDSTPILKDLNQEFDWIYIDPSRRNDAKGKVFMLKDCAPNVPELMDYYFNYSDNIMVKTAPILDITAGLSELKNVKEIHIVAVDNEVKELLWIIEKNYRNEITLKAINLLKNSTDIFETTFPEKESLVTFSLPKKYLYEPNSAIMKSGAFNTVASHYSLDKLHPNSHLYTSDILIAFPGRIFEIEKAIPYHKTEMKTLLMDKKANVTIRNFSETVENIRKKWKIKEGGNLYSFFTTDENDDKIVLLCSKLK